LNKEEDLTSSVVVFSAARGTGCPRFPPLLSPEQQESLPVVTCDWFQQAGVADGDRLCA